jgi:Family of unknown function (DUF5706)
MVARLFQQNKATSRQALAKPGPSCKCLICRIEKGGEAKMSDKEADQRPTLTPNSVHLVRTLQQLNLSLSQMADQKASILMGATFVVFTISIGQASRGEITLPLLVLALFSFISAMLAVFAILPSVSPRPSENPNILFFGNFTHMSDQEFADAVIARLSHDEDVFRTMLKDIYQNGQVLQRKKYKYLGLAYRAFLAGLVLTVAAVIAGFFKIGI